MSIILQDDFTGADGLVNGRVPPTNYSSNAWVSAGSTQQGGCLIASNKLVGDGYYAPATLADSGSCTYSFGGATINSLEGSFTLVLGATINGATPFDPITIGFEIYGAFPAFTISYEDVAGWLMYCGATAVDISSVITSGGTLTCSFALSDGAQSFTVNGITATSTDAFTNTWQGLAQLTMSVGGFAALDTMSVDNTSVLSTANLTCPMGTLEATGSIHPSTADLVCPPPTLVFQATMSGIISANLSAPRATVSAYTGGAAQFSPLSPLLSSLGHDSTGEQAAYLTAPSPTLAITTGASAKALRAPTPTLAATGTVTASASAALRAPRPTLAATGTVSSMARAALRAPGANLVGYSGAVCSITLTGKAMLSASGTTGGIASVAVTCPLFELTATATAQNHGSANLLAPSPRLGAQAQAWLTAPSARLTAIGSAVVTATYEAYAVNLGHRPRVTNQELPIDEVTRYTNFPFTHVVRYLNSYYGANSTGLYLLEGTTDAGTAIPWAVKTAMDDFKTPVKKTVAAAYFGGRFGPASTVQLHAGEDTPNTYSFTTPRDALAQNHRQVFGKGVKERYYALGASGTGVCELDTVELETHNMTRRI